ncbi:MAG TPA: hypothetical protein VGM52_10480 [Herbaspirillum sp.]
MSKVTGLHRTRLKFRKRSHVNDERTPDGVLSESNPETAIDRRRYAFIGGSFWWNIFDASVINPEKNDFILPTELRLCSASAAAPKDAVETPALLAPIPGGLHIISFQI